MAFKTWASGDILTASDLNTFVVKCQSLYKMVAGTTSFSLSSANSVSVSVSWGVTFTTLIACFATPNSGSNIDLVTTIVGPNTTGMTVRLAEKSGLNVTESPLLNWMAIGT